MIVQTFKYRETTRSKKFIEVPYPWWNTGFKDKGRTYAHIIIQHLIDSNGKNTLLSKQSQGHRNDRKVETVQRRSKRLFPKSQTCAKTQRWRPTLQSSPVRVGQSLLQLCRIHTYICDHVYIYIYIVDTHMFTIMKE